MHKLVPSDHWLDADGIRLHYVEWPGDGPTVLCIHGLSGNARTWDALAERLAPGFRVVAPDLRGRGLSDKPQPGSYGLQAHVRDMRILVQSLGPGPVFVAGHSMGAFIASLLAAGYPHLVSRLVLMDGGGLGPEMSEATIRPMIQNSLNRLKAVFPSYDAYLAFWRQMPFLTPWDSRLEPFLEADVEVRSDGTVVSLASPAAIEEDLATNVSAYDMHSVLPAIEVPTTVLWAGTGVVNPAEPMWPRPVADEVARLLPHGRLVPVPAANHYTILLHPYALEQIEAALRS